MNTKDKLRAVRTAVKLMGHQVIFVRDVSLYGYDPRWHKSYATYSPFESQWTTIGNTFVLYFNASPNWFEDTPYETILKLVLQGITE